MLKEYDMKRDSVEINHDAPQWSHHDADPGSLDVQCTGLGGGELDEEWDVLLACKKEAHVYGPSLSKQDDWNAKRKRMCMGHPSANKTIGMQGLAQLQALPTHKNTCCCT